ncbi:hypothetical protein NM208_g13422 [Fusarium decemcellulare]|uniref:Uncharacterized protein n=1 Tax=Fusarium decemcellulare TaxID=57161 RepID=A0ACC1RMF6_9HYPO|nr:hypothetical protein NM208_g13422 [Fusarium decemcellulare]
MAPNPEVLDSSRPDPEFEQACCSFLTGPPPLPSNTNVQTLRRLTNEFKNKARENLDGPLHELVERNIEIPVRDSSSILAYVYAPSKEATDALPIFLFFHGGGFCIGSRHDDLESNRIIASKTGIIVVSLEYRLAPEHPFPQAIHDGFDALHWIANNPSRVHPAASPSSGLIVGGTSAGGSIANAVVYLNRDLGSPVTVTGQLLSVAPLLPPPVVPRKYQDDYISHKQNKDVAIPSEELTQLFLAAYKPDKSSPLAAPAIHPLGHAGIPPTYLQACGLDRLRDESLIYQRILEHENGIATRLDLYPGLPHHFWEFFPQLTKQVEKRTNDTVEGIQWLLEAARANPNNSGYLGDGSVLIGSKLDDGFGIVVEWGRLSSMTGLAVHHGPSETPDPLQMLKTKAKDANIK